MSVSTYHEDVCRFEIEAELAQACPRRVRVPTRAASRTLIALFAYALAGAVALLIALHSFEMIWLSHSGAVVQARLISVNTNAPAPAEESPATIVPSALSDSADEFTGTLREDYEFVLGGKVHRGWTDIDGNLPDASTSANTGIATANPTSVIAAADPSAAQTLIPVRAGWWLGRFVYAPVGMIPPDLESGALAAAAALAIVLVAWAAWARGRSLMRAFLLLRHGDALIATVRDKEIVPGEISRYFVTCGFIALSGQIVSVRERCTPEQWRGLHLGDAVTVMHLPSRSGSRAAALYRHLLLSCAPRTRPHS